LKKFWKNSNPKTHKSIGSKEKSLDLRKNKMKVSSLKNGRLELRLSPEDGIDLAFISAFADAVSKSSPPKVKAEGDKDSRTLSVYVDLPSGNGLSSTDRLTIARPGDEE
jgi:hypothetical protein